MKDKKEPGRLAILLIQEKEWQEVKELVHQITHRLNELQSTSSPTLPVISDYITAIEFMNAVRISRSHLDNLIQENKIKTIKKRRKIYVLATEVTRYFQDPSI